MDEPTIEKIFNAAPVSLLVMRPDLTMVAATDEYLRSTLTTREGLVGRHVLDAFPDNSGDPDKVLVRSLERVLQTARADSVPVQGYDIPTDGDPGAMETRFWSVINSPVVEADGRVSYIVHRADDVTEVVSGRPDSPESSWPVVTQAAVVKRATDLQEANRLLREADMAKNDFLSRMSHELRTPLNAVIGFSQLLQMGTLSEDDEESVGQILKAGRHLLGLINDVLDLSGIESGRLGLSLEAVDLDEVLAETIDLLGPAAAAGSITLTLATDGRHFVHADRQRLKQVLLNLGSNAIKYNRAGGRVEFSASAASDTVEIGVADDGPGIAVELQHRLFVPFDRLGADQTAIEGTGLGLALSRTLMEAMGGTIRVESAPRAGSTFFVSLRGLPPTEVVEDVAARDQRHVRGAGTVLYVEDNLANVQLMERIVSRFPAVQLVTAMQGGLAIELARAHRPSLILLDLNLPDLHGDVVLTRLKADEATCEIPVVVVSADASARQIERLRRAGAESYLTKPLDLGELLRVLDAHLAPAGS